MLEDVYLLYLEFPVVRETITKVDLDLVVVADSFLEFFCLDYFFFPLLFWGEGGRG